MIALLLGLCVVLTHEAGKSKKSLHTLRGNGVTKTSTCMQQICISSALHCGSTHSLCLSLSLPLALFPLECRLSSCLCSPVQGQRTLATSCAVCFNCIIKRCCCCFGGLLFVVVILLTVILRIVVAHGTLVVVVVLAS